jgi:hypothetical protein
MLLQGCLLVASGTATQPYWVDLLPSLPATKLPTPDPPPQPPSPDLLGSPAFHHIAHVFKSTP